MSLPWLCAFAGVSISGYYAWKHHGPSRLVYIRNQFALSRETYTTPRMHVEVERRRHSGQSASHSAIDARE